MGVKVLRNMLTAETKKKNKEISEFFHIKFIYQVVGSQPVCVNITKTVKTFVTPEHHM